MVFASYLKKMTFSSDARIIDYSAIIKMTVFQKHTYHSQGTAALECDHSEFSSKRAVAART